jgi:hypothetical protein
LAEGLEQEGAKNNLKKVTTRNERFDVARALGLRLAPVSAIPRRWSKGGTFSASRSKMRRRTFRCPSTACPTWATRCVAVRATALAFDR